MLSLSLSAQQMYNQSNKKIVTGIAGNQVRIHQEITFLQYF